MSNQIKTTNDGSHSLVSEKFGELYHSCHGSFQEAMHIFIKHGLAQLNKKEINIFEMGFGTGLNAILSYYYAQKYQLKVNYYSIEAYPVPIKTVEKLNYNKFIKEENYKDIFLEMHQSPWGQLHEVSPYFHLKKIHNFIEKQELEQEFQSQIDLVYYDAFAPSAQQNLWEIDLLQKMYQILNVNGFLVSYCAQGKFKRCLKNIGFEVRACPGPIGKREITQAFKISMV